ncbi:hypothetical protein L0B53_13580 [Vibrio sp. SS-MA-C1-2]|uniref:hypothetical protein n=1 Tax=Vibrio sp. SS-MA-C1-2 TaxID=2908646 RepID=UPI001F42E65B|nr:hypothetical protein [Vibrio sp. SS-MA-C1-2]UJF18047.1 hypothetical protein L0B53_13580 [Vibrio sp. SS-MA-C1-2]
MARALPALALFGFIHGAHEWANLYLNIYQPQLEMQSTVIMLKAIKLFVSYIALVYFALKMLMMTRWRLKKLLSLSLKVAVFLFLIYAFIYHIQGSMPQHADLLMLQTRYIFGSAAGIIAGGSLIDYSYKLANDGKKWWAHFAFSVYQSLLMVCFLVFYI